MTWRLVSASSLEADGDLLFIIYFPFLREERQKGIIALSAEDHPSIHPTRGGEGRG